MSKVDTHVKPQLSLVCKVYAYIQMSVRPKGVAPGNRQAPPAEQKQGCDTVRRVLDFQVVRFDHQDCPGLKDELGGQGLHVLWAGKIKKTQVLRQNRLRFP
jgi:hypothetical protein